MAIAQLANGEGGLSCRNKINAAIDGVNNTNGFIEYNDLATVGSPVALVGGVWTTLPNDGLGPQTLKTYAPSGVTELIDTSTGAIDASELSLGDSLILRNDFTVTPNTNNQLLEFRYSAGTGGGVYTLERTLGKMDSGGSQPYRYALGADYIYLGDANTKDNPILIQIKSSGAGTFTNGGTTIQSIKMK
jgi:hypothetical protein